MALAETAPPDPVVADHPALVVNNAEVEGAVPAPAPAPKHARHVEKAHEAEADEVSEPAEGEGHGEQGEHGAAVSAAARDHSHDEACGTHGAFVSAVAKTGEQPACATAGTPAATSSESDHGRPENAGKADENEKAEKAEKPAKAEKPDKAGKAATQHGSGKGH